MFRIRNILALALAAVMALSVGALAETATQAPVAIGVEGPGERFFTLRELAEFDGKEGRPAYVAIEGIVYDVSEAPPYKATGEHGGLPAGIDITEAIKEAGHGENPLTKRPVVGRLLLELSLEELARYDGKDGRPAYAAVDGIVYDVSGYETWSGGEHKGAMAGQDLTEVYAGSPHKEDLLARMPRVGRLVLKLTLEQLREFDGKDGRPAYVAVDGIIYDMTNSRAWRNGMHNGFEAGRDLTREIKEVSPHGVGNLERVPEVGVIVE
ncbi:MAG TPA: cytochrome b5 domain-containing protein [Candidatus Limnocylindria bacterium]|nr:cytochrome b5 domain-containing protein [Candidatus Limnocylindria bacterium]